MSRFNIGWNVLLFSPPLEGKHCEQSKDYHRVVRSLEKFIHGAIKEGKLDHSIVTTTASIPPAAKLMVKNNRMKLKFAKSASICSYNNLLETSPQRLWGRRSLHQISRFSCFDVSIFFAVRKSVTFVSPGPWPA